MFSSTEELKLLKYITHPKELTLEESTVDDAKQCQEI